MRKITDKKGEGYVDIAITVLIFSFILIFLVNIVSLVSLSQNLKTVANLLTEYAAQNGSTDIEEYAAELSEKTGIDFGYSFSGSEFYDEFGNVQLGEKIVCTVTHKVSIIGFGKAVHSVNMSAHSEGLSRVYHK